MFSSMLPIDLPSITTSVFENSIHSKPGVQSMPAIVYPSYSSLSPETRYKSSFGLTVIVFLDTVPSLASTSSSILALKPFSFDTESNFT